MGQSENTDVFRAVHNYVTFDFILPTLYTHDNQKTPLYFVQSIPNLRLHPAHFVHPRQSENPVVLRAVYT